MHGCQILETPIGVIHSVGLLIDTSNLQAVGRDQVPTVHNFDTKNIASQIKIDLVVFYFSFYLHSDDVTK